MPFPRPTLAALRTSARADLAARLPGTDPALRRTAFGAIADVQAGLTHLQYGYLDWIVRQVIPDTAEGEYLDRWARLVGLSRKAAVASAGNVTFTGTNTTVIAEGTRLIRSDGATYATTAEGTISSGTATIAVEAEVAGADGDMDAGGSLSLIVAQSGVIGTATVATGGLSGGGPEETDAALRERLRARLATPPQGGAAADYVAWALLVPAVTRAWCRPLARGGGTVDVYVMCDGREDPIPTVGDIADVQAAIDLRRPVTANALAVAPTGVELDLEIDGLSPDTSAIRAAIRAEVADQIRRDAEPGGTIRRSRLIEAISRAAGESYHDLTDPVADVTYAADEIAVPGDVTFT